MDSKLSTFIILTLISISANACPNDPLCQQCRNNICTYCVYSYPNSAGVCTAPTSIIPGCYVYSSNTVCARCQDGYYFNAQANVNNTCTVLDNSISQFCRYSFISTTSCSACTQNVLQNGGGCIPNSSCADQNCESCFYDLPTGNQYCMVCSTGYVLWAGALPNVCIPMGNMVGCLSAFTLNYCDRCAPGYYWQNGVCVETSGTRFGSGMKFSVVGMVALIMVFFRN